MAVLSLALGIGSCTAVFSIFNGLCLRALPFPGEDRLVDLQENSSTYKIFNRAVPLQNLHAWEKSEAFRSVAGFSLSGSYLTGFGPVARVGVANVTRSMAATLGITPVLGRDFLPEEDRGADVWSSAGAHRVTLLSYGFWRRYFGGATDAIGKTVRLDNIPFLVIGVLPQTAVFPPDADVWVTPGYGEPNSPAFVHHGVGRLREGVTVAQAAADLLRIQKGMIPLRPANRFLDPVVVPLREFYLGDYQSVSRILLAAVGFVLLIAALNVSGLMLARGTARAREFAIRTALGASRFGLIRQLLVETLLLACIGGAAGALLGWVTVRGVVSLMAARLPSWVDFGVDLNFLWFAAAVVGMVALLSSLAPALELSKATASSLAGGLRSSIPRGVRRGMNFLVTGEIAVTLVLLAGGGLVLKAFHRVMSVAPGFEPDSALSFSIDPPGFINSSDFARSRNRFAQDLLTRLRSTPGIDAAGLTDALPIAANRTIIVRNVPLQAEDAPPPDPRAPLFVANARLITPGYLRAMGVSLLNGRDLDERDGDDAVVVNESLARRFWPQGGAVGKRLRQSNTPRMLTVVGVAADIRDDGLDRPPVPQIFQRYPATAGTYIDVVLRGRLDAASLSAVAREAARAIDPNIAIFDVQTLRQIVDQSLGVRRAYTWLFGAFAAIALVMAIAGVYGVMSYSVAQRTREIGIRMALGAQRSRVLRDILRGAAMLAAIGAAIGLAGAWFASRLMQSLLAGVGSHDPQAYLLVIALLAIAVLAAALIPARRAASVDPIRALKYE
jgi:predicted permease